MRKVIFLIIFLFPFLAFGAETSPKKDFPGNANLTWTFSESTSYPETGASNLEPKELYSQIARIDKLQDGGPYNQNCQTAVLEYKKLLTKYPNETAAYASIPTCRLAEKFLEINKIIKNGKGLSVELSKLQKSTSEMKSLYSKGEEFFKKRLAQSSNAKDYKDYFKFAVNYLFLMGTIDFISNFSVSADADPTKIDEYFMAQMNQLQSRLTEEPFVAVLKKITELDPKDTRYEGMLGSMLVGQSYIKAIGAYIAATMKNDKTDFLEVLKGINADPDFSKNLNEGISVLKNYKNLSKSVQANSDLGLAYTLKGNFKAARNFYMNALAISKSAENPYENLVATIAIEGFSKFKEDKKEADKVLKISSDRISSIKDLKPYDYLITAKLFYMLDMNSEAQKYVDIGLSKFQNDQELLSAKKLF